MKKVAKFFTIMFLVSMFAVWSFIFHFVATRPVGWREMTMLSLKSVELVSFGCMMFFSGRDSI